MLGQTLEFFDQHEPGLGANDLLAREIIIDVLCRRHHEIDAAYQSWKRDADAGIVDKLGDIVAAVIRSLGPRYVYRYNNEAVCGTLAEYALAWQQTGPTPQALSPEVIAAGNGQCLTVMIDELDGYDNGDTSGIVYRFTAGEDVIEHRIPHTTTADALAIAEPADDSGEVLIARLDESYTDSGTGQRFPHIREVRFRVNTPNRCDHREGSICATCAPRWQLDYDFDMTRFPFPLTPRVGIAELIKNGTLRPGQKLGNPAAAATITHDGGLLLPDGRIFDNPTAAQNALTTSRPTPETTSGDALPDVPPDCWHVERLPHHPGCVDRDRVVAVAIDATSAAEAERRTLAWARHPDSGITEPVGDNAATAADIGLNRWAVVLDISGGQQ
ncbi:hypothetical protein OG203_30915 [Nocardia sp. NBC_01499]|uniref:hypothetical protein n=1 Tax=Nocardia sp. NBC_01499 TaxID=2903597 RepID=UPI00386E3571